MGQVVVHPSVGLGRNELVVGHQHDIRALIPSARNARDGEGREEHRNAAPDHVSDSVALDAKRLPKETILGDHRMNLCDGAVLFVVNCGDPVLGHGCKRHKTARSSVNARREIF